MEFLIMTVTAKRGPVYDPEIEKQTFSPEDLEKARKDYAQLEKEAPRFQAALDQGVQVEGLDVVALIEAEQALNLYQRMHACNLLKRPKSQGSQSHSDFLPMDQRTWSIQATPRLSSKA